MAVALAEQMCVACAYCVAAARAVRTSFLGQVDLALSSSHAAAWGSIFSFANSRATVKMDSCSCVRPHAGGLLLPASSDASMGVLEKCLLAEGRLLVAAACCGF